MDGDVPSDQWKKLIHHHFRGNPLVGEYFGASNVATPVEPAVDSATGAVDPYSNLVPYQIEPTDGLRLVLAYRKLPDVIPEKDSFVEPTRVVSIDERQVPVMDLAFLDLRKILAQTGADPETDSHATFFRYEDRYHEIPLIIHRTPKALESTLTGLRDVLRVWNNGGKDIFLALSLALIEDERLLSFSLYGHIRQILHWLDRSNPFPPERGRDQWVNRTADYLAQFGRANDRPPLCETISEGDLTFRIDRVLLPDNCGTWQSSGYLINPEKLPTAVAQAMQEGRVEPAAAYLVRELCCSKCSGNYLICGCSNPADFGALSIKDQEVAYLFWTDLRVAGHRSAV